MLGMMVMYLGGNVLEKEYVVGVVNMTFGVGQSHHDNLDGCL
jgi:hypothetical protein